VILITLSYFGRVLLCQHPYKLRLLPLSYVTPLLLGTRRALRSMAQPPSGISGTSDYRIEPCVFLVFLPRRPLGKCGVNSLVQLGPTCTHKAQSSLSVFR